MGKTKKKEGGRPSVMTESVVRILEEAFVDGLSDREACIFAGIGRQTLYDYCKKNPEFSDRKEGLKMMPTINAKRTIAKAVQKDPAMALKYLERKERDEWAPPTVKQDIKVTSDLEDKTDEQLDEEIAAIEEELAKREELVGDEPENAPTSALPPQ